MQAQRDLPNGTGLDNRWQSGGRRGARGAPRAPAEPEEGRPGCPRAPPCQHHRPAANWRDRLVEWHWQRRWVHAGPAWREHLARDRLARRPRLRTAQLGPRPRQKRRVGPGQTGRRSLHDAGRKRTNARHDGGRRSSSCSFPSLYVTHFNTKSTLARVKQADRKQVLTAVRPVALGPDSACPLGQSKQASGPASVLAVAECGRARGAVGEHFWGRLDGAHSGLGRARDR